MYWKDIYKIQIEDYNIQMHLMLHLQWASVHADLRVINIAKCADSCLINVAKFYCSYVGALQTWHVRDMSDIAFLVVSS